MSIRKKAPESLTQAVNLIDRRLDFSQSLLKCAVWDKPQVEFLADTLMLTLEHSGCESVELWLKNREGILRYEASMPEPGKCNFKTVFNSEDNHVLEKVCSAFLGGNIKPSPDCCTKYGSIWFDDTRELISLTVKLPGFILNEDACIGGLHRSLAVVPLKFLNDNAGLILFKHIHEHRFSLERIGYLETISTKFEMAYIHQLSQAKLRERVKELTCLYGISQIAANPEMSFEQKLTEIASLLPPAWQYPDRACARIIIDGSHFQTKGFKEGQHRQEAAICIAGRSRGIVEIHYIDSQPFVQRSPFLNEEQHLIDSIAGQIAHMIKHKEVETAKAELQRQLIRADRLAAIGQLAAGVAHELNEPLNTILGFAQLAQKAEGMPRQVIKDVGRIADASLHARSIIKELLVFARQTTPARIRVNLNAIISEDLKLFETLCKKSNVEFRRIIDKDLPDITADKSQLLQVISNLIVNALQAMPNGGLITIRTSFHAPMVCLMIEDTGTGMSTEVKENIFLPFFTTKDIDQGTGLGLSVVHGIVSSHNGDIHVESIEGKGTRFIVKFPCSNELTDKE